MTAAIKLAVAMRSSTAGCANYCAFHVTGRFNNPRNAQPPIRTGSESSSRKPSSRAKMLGSATSATIAREAKAPAQ